jgi:hypothetical protein
MDKKIKAKWLKALTSGRYKQARKKLRVADKFCCLGVLCDLYAKETGEKWEKSNFLGDRLELPIKVQSWACLSDGNPDVPVMPAKRGDELCHTLAELNDHGYTFKEIAAVIRKQF